MEQREQLLNESFCNIYYSDSVIYAEWKGFLKLDQVKKGCLMMTKEIKNNNTKMHLSDHRELRVLSKEVQDYLTQEWFPQVEAAGLKKVAALVSDDVFAKATVDKVNTTAKVGNLTIKTFNAKKDCLDWFDKIGEGV
ncbi:MAG: hypothetical protein ABJH05_11750 [Fulvivirga sp.]